MFESLPEIASVLLGALSPVLIQYLKPRIKSKNWRFTLALVLSGGLGAVIAWQAGVPVNELPTFATYAFAASQAVYQYWKGLV